MFKRCIKGTKQKFHKQGQGGGGRFVIISFNTIYVCIADRLKSSFPLYLGGSEGYLKLLVCLCMFSDGAKALIRQEPNAHSSCLMHIAGRTGSYPILNADLGSGAYGGGWRTVHAL